MIGNLENLNQYLMIQFLGEKNKLKLKKYFK